MAERKDTWYRKHNVKHVTGFLSPGDKKKLQKLADMDDKSLVLYVTRLLERHLRDKEKEGAFRKEEQQEES